MFSLHAAKRSALLILITAGLILGNTGIHPDNPVMAAAQKRVDEPQNIAFDFLDMEKPLGAGRAHYEYISGLIRKARTKLPLASTYSRAQALALLRGIDSLLRGEKFVFKNNLLLSRGIDAKTLDCDNYCTLYTAIAEVLKIPIVPVYAPNHSFMRFYLDDGAYINWETTKAASYGDDYYVKALRIADSSLRKGVYMRTLSRKEFIGVQYNNIGAHLMSARKFADAVPCFTMALECNPKFSSAYHNRGTALYAARRLTVALEDLLTACDLDPNRPSTRITLGDIYLDLKEYDRAADQYQAAIRLDPGNYIPYNNMALILKETGREAESRQWFQKSLEIKNRKR